MCHNASTDYVDHCNSQYEFAESKLDLSKFEVKRLVCPITYAQIINVDMNMTLEFFMGQKNIMSEDEFNRWFGEWFWNNVKEKCEVKF